MRQGPALFAWIGRGGGGTGRHDGPGPPNPSGARGHAATHPHKAGQNNPIPPLKQKGGGGRDLTTVGRGFGPGFRRFSGSGSGCQGHIWSPRGPQQAIFLHYVGSPVPKGGEHGRGAGGPARGGQAFGNKRAVQKGGRPPSPRSGAVRFQGVTPGARPAKKFSKIELGGVFLAGAARYQRVFPPGGPIRRPSNRSYFVQGRGCGVRAPTNRILDGPFFLNGPGGIKIVWLGGQVPRNQSGSGIFEGCPSGERRRAQILCIGGRHRKPTRQHPECLKPICRGGDTGGG